MTARTYDELFEPEARLSLVHVRDDKYIVWDQHCRFYILVPSPLDMCLRFMQAMADKGDAVLDDASIERATWHSVKVPALEAGEAAPSRDVDGTSPASNVVPLRRRETA